MERVLLFQTAFLGDCVLSTPVIRGISELHRDAEISVATHPAAKEIFQYHPLVKDVLLFDKRGKHRGLKGVLSFVAEIRKHEFSVVYSLHKSWRTAVLLFLSRIPRRIGFKEAKLRFLYTDRRSRARCVHDVLRNVSILGERWSSVVPELELYPPPGPEARDKLGTAIGVRNSYIIAVPGSAWKTKQWSTLGFQQVVQSLSSHGHQVVLLGSPSERFLCQEVIGDSTAVNLAGETSIGEMVSLISRASLVLCNDSMALHVASSFKVPTVTIFCATVPAPGFGPWNNDRAMVVEKKGLWCRPCRRHGGTYCPTGTYECIRGITAESVLSGVSEVLAKDI